MPGSRPAWNGFLKLSFVSCPIALYPATSAAERLSFRQVNRRTGHRLKHKLVDSVTGEQVASSDKARGYETARDEFLFVEERDMERARSERLPPGAIEVAAPYAPSRRDKPSPGPEESYETENKISALIDEEDEDELEEFAPSPRPQNTRTIEIERFVPTGQVDARYFEKPYYVVPRGEVSQEAFAVIRDAMASEEVAGLARIVLSSRERPFLLEAMGQGLRGVTLRFAQEVRPEQDYFSDIPSLKLSAEMARLAQHIIKSKSAQFDPAMLEDHYRAALVRILQKKQREHPSTVPASPPSRENVINLMDALRRSIKAEDMPRKPLATRHASKRRKAPVRRE